MSSNLKQFNIEPGRDFFENKDFIASLDMMARRYTKLPTELLDELTVYEFSLNMAIMLAALKIETKNNAKNNPKNKQRAMSFGKLGFGYRMV